MIKFQRLLSIVLVVFSSGLAGCNAMLELAPVAPAPANRFQAEPPPAAAVATPAVPTPAEPEPTPAPAPVATPEIDLTDLSPFRQAMLPSFSGDVDKVAARGASRYYIELTLDTSPAGEEELRLEGVERISYTNTESVALSEIYFQLYPNLPGYGGRMEIDTVVIDGQIVLAETTADGAGLRAPLAVPLEPGQVADITLFYRAIVPGRVDHGYNIFSHTDGAIALANFYPAVAVYDDDGWSVNTPPPYGDATYLDTSLYLVKVTVPEQMVVAASGSLLRDEPGPAGSRTLTLASGPMRDFYLAMRPDYRVISETVQGITVNSYYPAGLDRGGELALRYAADALRVFNRDFGPYPYAELDVAATATTAGGVEYPGIVVIAQTLYDESGGFFEHATVHEVAHQWWYGLVGNDQVNAPWLDEALTNYSTVFYWQEVGGPELANQIIESLFFEPYQRARAQGRDRAVMGPVETFNQAEYATFVYGKGPLFFYALHREVGTETFLNILQTYHERYKYQVVQPEDLLETIEQVSNRNIEPLVELWLAAE